jgi:hypothetical protein
MPNAVIVVIMRFCPSFCIPLLKTQSEMRLIINPAVRITNVWENVRPILNNSEKINEAVNKSE